MDLISGDAVDVHDGVILTGSWRVDHQLQLWDFGSGKLIEEIQWGNSAASEGSSCMLYAASFSRDGMLVAAGGSGSNEAKVFDRSCGNALVGTVGGMTRGVYSVDFNHDGTKLAVAGGDATVRRFDISGRGNRGGEGRIVSVGAKHADAGERVAAEDASGK